MQKNVKGKKFADENEELPNVTKELFYIFVLFILLRVVVGIHFDDSTYIKTYFLLHLLFLGS